MVNEIILKYYDARSKKHKNHTLLSEHYNKTVRKLHIALNGYKNDDNNKETPSGAKHDNEFTY